MRKLIRVALATLALSTFACSAQEAAPKFELDKHYKKVRQAEVPADPKRIKVQEFFWYGCPHCWAFDPVLKEWVKNKKPADVDFEQVPNSLGRPNGLVHSKTFYSLEQLNVLDKLHMKVFDAIHKEHRNLDTAPAMQDFVTRELGLMPDVFASTFSGFAVDSRVRKAEEATQKFAISSVPTMVVGGTYYSNAQMAGDFNKLTQMIEFLVDKVRKERAGK